MVVIFGKDTCPYTLAARDDYARRGVAFEYVNVKKNPAELDRMLEYSLGRRAVPVIVEEDGSVVDRVRRHVRRLGAAGCGAGQAGQRAGVPAV